MLGLLVDEQLCVANDVDEENMADLQGDLFLGVSRRYIDGSLSDADGRAQGERIMSTRSLMCSAGVLSE
jgi:hypothetical protein